MFSSPIIPTYGNDIKLFLIWVNIWRRLNNKFIIYPNMSRIIIVITDTDPNITAANIANKYPNRV